MDDTQDTPTPKIASTIKLTPSEWEAFDILVREGYSFPADSRVGAIRKMLRKTWEEQFPETPFPKKEEHE